MSAYDLEYFGEETMSMVGWRILQYERFVGQEGANRHRCSSDGSRELFFWSRLSLSLQRNE
jgi:hypothetical protein